MLHARPERLKATLSYRLYRGSEALDEWRKHCGKLKQTR